ncbi:UPF0158 family protein [Spirosoma flavum]|uniref:UPF0158 family protein n=1 Tax=Spirosoma flavum TaxID=2048557 RepID=A0ABW6AGZ1_9BACT
MIPLNDSQLKDILDQQQIGMSCYVHRQTGQLITFPNLDQFSELETREWQADMLQVEAFAEQYWQVPSLSSGDTFRFMEQFVLQQTEEPFRSKLLVILSRPKPFRHYKDVIDRSGPYRQAWFAFRDEQTLAWLKRQLSLVD